ncbi:CLUMA_CG001895, isoform A [Clunio marinus]|uniref:CLUMA_CG001895, isoform A n=1 Tax=Clunio marinus TaxID=568069 RepID=A0A1J1HNR4_9DIPT|nr:CLUMA_CG001895, isoform A [Clunio marinus]
MNSNLTIWSTQSSDGYFTSFNSVTFWVHYNLNSKQFRPYELLSLRTLAVVNKEFICPILTPLKNELKT